MCQVSTETTDNHMEAYRMSAPEASWGGTGACEWAEMD